MIFTERESDNEPKASPPKVHCEPGTDFPLQSSMPHRLDMFQSRGTILLRQDKDTGHPSIKGSRRGRVSGALIQLHGPRLNRSRLIRTSTWNFGASVVSVVADTEQLAGAALIFRRAAKQCTEEQTSFSCVFEGCLST